MSDAQPADVDDPPDVELDARRRVDRLRRLATLLDDSIRVPGTGYRIGIDPLIGTLPVGGDLVTAALSATVVVEAWRLGAPDSLLARMVANIAVDTLAGSVPLLGDAFDAAWKANVRNVDILEEWVDDRPTTGTSH